MTRRELGMAAVGLAVGTDAEAQAPAAPDPAQAVRDGNKRNSDALTKFEIPIATEPAFRFEA